MSDNELVTVATYQLPAQAAMARNALDAAGIRAVVTDAEVVAMDWLLAPAVGGIKVQVQAADAEQAAALIREIDAGTGGGEIDDDELTRQALAEPREGV